MRGFSAFQPRFSAHPLAMTPAQLCSTAFHDLPLALLPERPAPPARSLFAPPSHGSLNALAPARRSLPHAKPAVHERKSGFAGCLQLVDDARKQGLLLDLLVHECPEEVLCRIVIFFDAERHDLVDHL